MAVMDIVMPFLKERGLLSEQSAKSKAPRG